MANYIKTPYRKVKEQIESGLPNDAVAITPTADGTGTGVIPADAEILNVDSENVAHWMTLPVPTACRNGKEFLIVMGGTGCELRSDDPAATSINGVTGEGLELALTADLAYIVKKTGDASWHVFPASGIPD